MNQSWDSDGLEAVCQRIAAEAFRRWENDRDFTRPFEVIEPRVLPALAGVTVPYPYPDSPPLITHICRGFQSERWLWNTTSMRDARVLGRLGAAAATPTVLRLLLGLLQEKGREYDLQFLRVRFRRHAALSLSQLAPAALFTRDTRTLATLPIDRLQDREEEFEVRQAAASALAELGRAMGSEAGATQPETANAQKDQAARNPRDLLRAINPREILRPALGGPIPITGPPPPFDAVSRAGDWVPRTVEGGEDRWQTLTLSQLAAGAWVENTGAGDVPARRKRTREVVARRRKPTGPTR